MPNPAPRLKITLGIGLCRWERLRLAVEKATELGAAEIRPMVTERSRPLIKGLTKGSAKGLKGKLERTVIESLKQCYRSWAPRVHEPTDLDGVLGATADQDLKLIFEQGGSLLTEMSPKQPESVLMLIGPEGGFTRAEVALARECGACVVTMGPRILRAETAGVAAVAIVLSALGEME